MVMVMTMVVMMMVMMMAAAGANSAAHNIMRPHPATAQRRSRQVEHHSSPLCDNTQHHEAIVDDAERYKVAL